VEESSVNRVKVRRAEELVAKKTAQTEV